VPEVTGKLRKSLKIRQKVRRQAYDYILVSVGTTVPYAAMVEFGTKPHRINGIRHPGAAPKPFLRPAFDQKSDEALEITKQHLRDAIEKGTP